MKHMALFIMMFSLKSISLSATVVGDTTKKWVGTWSTAPQLVEPGNMPPSPGLNNNSLRQVVRVSIGGDTIRVKFSNEFSTSAVTMTSVQIAASTGGNTINVSTNKELKFNGNSQVTMNAGVAGASTSIPLMLYQWSVVTAPVKSVVVVVFPAKMYEVVREPGWPVTVEDVWPK